MNLDRALYVLWQIFVDILGCEILVKAEFLNPGGSVKDRAALYLIKDAQERGVLACYLVCTECVAAIFDMVFDRSAKSWWNGSRRNCWKYRHVNCLVASTIIKRCHSL